MAKSGGAPFREIEHTGDLGIEIEADSRAELFRRAALALAQLMADTSAVRPRELRQLPVSAAGDAELMHEMLSVLLRVFLLDGFIWCEAAVVEDAGGLKISLRGEPFDPQRHEFYRELKAVTYHELAIHNDQSGWRARVIFDV